MAVDPEILRKHLEALEIMTKESVDFERKIPLHTFSIIPADLPRIADALFDPQWEIAKLIGETQTHEVSSLFVNHKDIRKNGDATVPGLILPSNICPIVAAQDMVVSVTKTGSVSLDASKPYGSSLFLNRMLELLTSLNFPCQKTEVELASILQLARKHCVIILDGSDMDSAIDIILATTWNPKLVTDYVVNNVLVQEHLYPEFLARLTNRTLLHVGEVGLIGTFAIPSYAESVKQATEEAAAVGAIVVGITNPRGLFAPTIIKEYRPQTDSRALSIFSFRNNAEATKIAFSMWWFFQFISIWGGDVSQSLSLIDGLGWAVAIWINSHSLGHHAVSGILHNYSGDVFPQPFFTSKMVRRVIGVCLQNACLKDYKSIFHRIDRALEKGPAVPTNYNVLIRRRNCYWEVKIGKRDAVETLTLILAHLYWGNKVMLNESVAEFPVVKAIVDAVPPNVLELVPEEVEDTLDIKGNVEQIIAGVFDIAALRTAVWFAQAT